MSLSKLKISQSLEAFLTLEALAKWVARNGTKSATTQTEMKDLSIKFAYFLRSNSNEVISFFIAIIGAYFSFLFSTKPNTLFLSLLSLSLTSLVIIVFLKSKGKDFYFIPLREYKDKKDWLGRGSFDYFPKGNAFLITDSEAGFIFSKCFNWVNYEISCEFKILNKYLGVILRATDLANYLMLQIRKDGIRPHFRVNGGWLPKEARESGLEFDSNKKLEDGVWYSLNINVSHNILNITILNKGQVLFERQWDIPSGYIAVPVRDKDARDQIVGMLDMNKNYVYGTIGFRNTETERALIRNLLIKKI